MVRLVRDLVRLIRRGPARSADPDRARHPGRGNRAVRTAGRGVGTVPDRVARSGVRLLSSSKPEAGTAVVRLRAAVVRGWPADRVCRRRGPDDPDQQLVAAYQADRGPGRDDRADWSVGPALGHVRGQRRDDAEREQPAGQGGHRERCHAA